MEIVEDLVFRQKLVDTLKDKHTDRKDEIVHASDLDFCLRKAYLNRIEPSPPDFTTLLQFMRGTILQAMLTTGKGEISYEWENITSSIDEQAFGRLIEFKTTITGSKQQFEKQSFYDHWVTRMMTYAIAKDTNQITLAVLYLLGEGRFAKTNSDPDLRCFTFTFTPDELNQHKVWLRWRRDEMLQAFRTKVAPGVATRIGSWECKSCPKFVKYCAKELLGVDS